ncbi:bifunctional lysylphosphatidylglycerol synthetase/lysine--tRNA ligase LysX [Kytococcus sedentarius]|uniref:bifunctional lysylphosphatidylglycerol synthetase/lysine--tRNA ligase LysX n=1 Tax=Kytococcus sedentarius TaxID=1276 RepID=UPI0035BBD644
MPSSHLVNPALGTLAPEAPSTGWRPHVPRALATLLVLNGLFALVLALVPRWYDGLTATVDQYYLSVRPSFALATMLLVIAGALAARKRAGWLLMLGYLGILLLGDVFNLVWGITPHSVAGTLLHLAWLALALTTHRQFYASARSGSWVSAGVVLILGTMVAVVLGWLLVRVFPGGLPPKGRLLWSLDHVLALGTSWQLDSEAVPPQWVTSLLGLMGSAVVVLAVIVLLRSATSHNSQSPREQEAVRALLRRHGANDSLGYFATRDDKAVVFSSDGRAAVAYRVERGVSLASGDPVGDPAAWSSAIHNWLLVSRRFGWAPAAIGVSGEGARAYHDRGLGVLALGDEAILETDGFSLSGPRMASVRQAVQRARRAGVVVQVRRHEQVEAHEWPALRAAADAWRGDAPERGFSMALGRLGDPADGQCVLVEARDDAGELVGLLSFVPWGPVGASLDLMRRSPTAPNGVTETMVAELCRQAETVGIRRLSLNFAVFRSVFAEGGTLGAGPVVRVQRWLLRRASRWWQLESLYTANERYLPQWRPRYLCFGQTEQLARIGLATATAEGFLPRLPLPRWGRTGPRYAPVPVTAPDAGALEDWDSLQELEASRRSRRPEQVRVRMATVEAARSAGHEPWPVAQVPTHTTLEALRADEGEPLSLAGRVLAVRDLGGVRFVHLRDGVGDLQVVLEEQHLSPADHADFGRFVDLGDLVAFQGHRGSSRSGEPSLIATGWRMEAKSLHPLPPVRTGLVDPEAKVRRRHVDLAISTEARETLRARSTVLRSLREGLQERGYLEVETPILQTVHGGANARPFATHINAYSLDLSLRIAPELYLKRLCVGGIDRVFEIGRAFRNEGVDATHNPEFTILEAYAAHGDYLSMLQTVQELIQSAAVAVHGECVVPGPDGTMVDISGDWPVVTLHDAVSERLVELGGSPVHAQSPLEEMRRAADLAGVAVKPDWDAGHVALELYEQLVEGRTTRPTFYCDFPTSVSPLTRSHRSTPNVTERWDLVAFGMELGTAYSELTDPLEQRARLTAQSAAAAAGDPEAMSLDEDFLEALEYGMPPTGGLGLGVDRVVMLVTGRTIRETLAFPLVRPAGRE